MTRSASVSMRSLMSSAFMALSPQPIARGIEEQRLHRRQLDLIARSEIAVGRGQRDNPLLADLEVKMVLIAEMLDPLDLAGGAAAIRLLDADVLGPQADDLGAGGRRAGRQQALGDEVDRGLPEPGRHIDAVRILVDPPRR